MQSWWSLKEMGNQTHGGMRTQLQSRWFLNMRKEKLAEENWQPPGLEMARKPVPLRVSRVKAP